MKSSRYDTRKVKILAITQMVLGLFAISLGIPSASPSQASFPYGTLGYGIWGGVLYIINGCVGFYAATNKSVNIIIWHLVISIGVAIIATLQFSLGIASANQDLTILKLRYWADHSMETNDKDDVQYYYDLREFYAAFFPMTEMLGRKNNKISAWVHPGTVAVDSLLAIGGLLMMFCATLSAVSGCRVTCCSNLEDDDDQEAGRHQKEHPAGKGSSTAVHNPEFVHSES